MSIIKHNKELSWNFILQTERSHGSTKYARGQCGLFYGDRLLIRGRQHQLERHKTMRQNLLTIRISGQPPENEGQIRITSGTFN